MKPRALQLFWIWCPAVLGVLFIHCVCADESDARIDRILQLADKRAAKYAAAWKKLDGPLPPEFADPPNHPTKDESEKSKEPELHPVSEELHWHGGSYLYEPTFLSTRQLPQGYQKPKPITRFQEFLGADAIAFPTGSNGDCGFVHEPRFVGYGSYSLIGLGFDGNNPSVPRHRQRTSGIGHQLILDLDFRWTGTERMHVQFRPLGRENSGGSILLLDGDVEYDDNSTLIPERYWIEGEVFSLFRGYFPDEFTPRDYHIILGKFPFALHNNLLLSEELLGVAVNKNTLLPGNLSNLNIQLFYGFDDGEAFEIDTANLLGTHWSADYRHVFLECTLAGVFSDDPTRQGIYGAASVTRLFGPLTLAARAMYRRGETSHESGGLYVLESNYTKHWHGDWTHATGIEHTVFYATAFRADPGWQSMAGGNFDRLRSAFAVNPLVAIGRNPVALERHGIALGAQTFRDHEDTSFIPEVAIEEVRGVFRGGVGATLLHQLGRRTFLDLRGVSVWSEDNALRQEGVFGSVIFVF